MKKSFIRCSSLITLLFSVIVLVCGTGAPREAWAHASGVSYYSGNPNTKYGAVICTACHSCTATTGCSAPTVALTGPTSLTTGTSAIYTLTITGGPASVGGLDVSTTAGTLQAADSYTQVMNYEITHKSPPVSFTGNSVSFMFSLNTPTTAGSLTLYAAGLSANGDKNNNGDTAAATSLNVTVSAPSVPHIVVTDSVAPANDLKILFGTVYDNLTSDQTVTISNTGTANLTISPIATANPLAAPFSIPVASDSCSNTTLLPGGNCSLTVRFAPTSPGTFTDSFDIPSDDSTSPTTMSVSGNGATPPSQIVISPSNLQIPFGTVNDGLTSSQTVTISNSGTGKLIIGSIESLNPLAAPFSIPVDTCSGQTIAQGGACTLIVQFAPTSGGPFSDSFDIPSNDPTASSVTMSVSGTGNAPPTAPTLVSPTDGQTVTGTTATLVWNKSTDPDNDSITYLVYNCPDSSMSCTPVTAPVTASNGPAGIYFAGSGFLFVGFVFARGRGRKLMLMLMIAVLLMCGVVFISCGSGGGGSSAPATVSYQASGLNAGTTYYWKVVADDGHAQTQSTTTWSYTTTAP